MRGRHEDTPGVNESVRGTDSAGWRGFNRGLAGRGQGMVEPGWRRTLVKCLIVVIVLTLAAWASYSVKRAWLAQSKGVSSVLAPATRKLEIVEEIRPAVHNETIPREEAREQEAIVKELAPAESLVDVSVDKSPKEGIILYLKADGRLGDYNTFVLKKPTRLVVDLWKLKRRFAQTVVGVHSGYVRKVRLGDHPKKVRVVLDMSTKDLPPHRIDRLDEGLRIVFGRVLGPQVPVPKPKKVLAKGNKGFRPLGARGTLSQTDSEQLEHKSTAIFAEARVPYEVEKSPEDMVLTTERKEVRSRQHPRSVVSTSRDRTDVRASSTLRGSKPIAQKVVRPQVVLPPSSEREEKLDDYLEIGALYARKGKYQKAEELFERVIQKNPSSPKARNNLGFVYLKQGKYDLAEREFKQALKGDPASVLPYYNLACLYSRKGMEVEALICLKKALKRDERVKLWALADEDFEGLRSDVVFQELVGTSSPKK